MNLHLFHMGRMLILIVLWISHFAMNAAELTGSGTQESPYLIQTAEDIETLRNRVNSGDDCRDLYFKLTNDIHCKTNSASIWVPIGIVENINHATYAVSGKPFNGKFNGHTYTISHLYSCVGEKFDYSVLNHPQDPADVKGLGLFGYLGPDAEISNLTVSAVTFFGNEFVGALAGVNEGKIDNVRAIGSVASASYAGGIAGLNIGTIRNCNTTFETALKGANLGGIVGINKNGNITHSSIEITTITPEAANGIAGIVVTNREGLISHTYVVSNGAKLSGNHVAGIATQNTGNGVIQYSYATFPAIAQTSLAGCTLQNSGSVTSTYSVIENRSNAIAHDGFCFQNEGTFTQCFFNTDSGYTTQSNAIQKTDAEMKAENFAVSLNPVHSPDSPFSYQEGAYPTLLNTQDLKVIYVKTPADGGDDTAAGTSWGTAFATIQKAITSAGEKGYTEIWVAQGDYPLTSTTIPGTASKLCGFYMASNIAVRGSFVIGDKNPEKRDFDAHPTRFYRAGEGDFNLVRIHNSGVVGDNCTLDGLVFDGCSDTYQNLDLNGNAITCNAKSPTFSNCVFKNCNTYNCNGVAVYVWTETDVATFNNCSFLDNTSNSTINSGGICCIESQSARMDRCLFANNFVSGIGMVNVPKGIFKCTNSVFVHNTAGTSVCLEVQSDINDASVYIENCTFAKNKCSTDEGVLISTKSTATLQIVNSIIYANELKGNLFGGNTQQQVSYTCYEGNVGSASIGVGCMQDVSPIFVNTTLPAGRIDGWETENFALQDSSPCINVGNNDSVTVPADRNNNARIYISPMSKPIVDLGAYENYTVIDVINFAHATQNDKTAIRLYCPAKLTEDYTILRSEDKQTWTSLKTDYRGDASFEDISAIPGKLYYYKLEKTNK